MLQLINEMSKNKKKHSRVCEIYLGTQTPKSLENFLPPKSNNQSGMTGSEHNTVM